MAVNNKFNWPFKGLIACSVIYVLLTWLPKDWRLGYASLAPLGWAIVVSLFLVIVFFVWSVATYLYKRQYKMTIWPTAIFMIIILYYIFLFVYYN